MSVTTANKVKPASDKRNDAMQKIHSELVQIMKKMHIEDSFMPSRDSGSVAIALQTIGNAA